MAGLKSWQCKDTTGNIVLLYKSARRSLAACRVFPCDMISHRKTPMHRIPTTLFEEAIAALKIQYETSKQLNFELGMCRAIGTMGMVNYQLSLVRHDKNLPNLAIEQLEERVERARNVKHALNAENMNPHARTEMSLLSVIHESVGLDRSYKHRWRLLQPSTVSPQHTN